MGDRTLQGVPGRAPAIPLIRALHYFHGQAAEPGEEAAAQRRAHGPVPAGRSPRNRSAAAISSTSKLGTANAASTATVNGHDTTMPWRTAGRRKPTIGGIGRSRHRAERINAGATAAGMHLVHATAWRSRSLPTSGFLVTIRPPKISIEITGVPRLRCDGLRRQSPSTTSAPPTGARSSALRMIAAS
jgi:hypothetical protein